MEILTIETPSLGDRTYLVTDGEVAAVIDPQRDIDRIEQVLTARDLRLTDVFETHIHNDYVTGGYQLAQRHDADYHVAAGEDVAFERSPVEDGDEIKVGTFVVRAVHTPGHTPTHLSFVLSDGTLDVAVFTGGSMLYGSVGRTDLISADATEDLTRKQFRSVRRLVDELADDVEVRPTHGFGSFCSSGETSEQDASTIGTEKTTNQALTIADEDDFVTTLIAGLDAYPAYYAHMAPLNLAGPAPVDLSPAEPVDTTELLRRIHVGEWVVDLRTRTAFAADHVRGTINVELSDQASTYLGWLVPWVTATDAPAITLIADTAEEIAEVQRQLVRIGIDRPAGQLDGGMDAVGPDAPRGSYEVTDFAGLRRLLDDGRDLTVLDIRLRGEWDAGHISGAVHVPLHELEARLDEIPDGEVAVHCAGGYRAGIGASLLERAGRTPVLVDDSFGDNAAAAFDLVS